MDPSLARGEGWIMCALCGEIHHAPFPDLYVDENGTKWDVCKACQAREQCANDAHDMGG